VIVAAELRLVAPSKKLADELSERLTYANPAYAAALRYKTWTKPPKYLRNFRRDGNDLCIPRGFARRLRKMATRHELTVGWVDRREVAPVEFPARDAIDDRLRQAAKPIVVTARQQASVDALVATQNAYLQASTGYGKTLATLLAVAKAGQRTLYLVPGDLTRTQVLKTAASMFGSSAVCKLGGRPHDLAPVMIATYDLAWGIVKRGGDWLRKLQGNVGTLVCDEAHMTGAPTRVKTVAAFAAKYRWGATATPERKDGLHSLVFDLFGEPADVITYDEAVDAGRIVSVRINVVQSATRDRDYEITKFGRTCSACALQILRSEMPPDKRCDCGGVFQGGALLDAALNAQLYSFAEEALRNDTARTAMIAERVARYHAEGHTTLVLARRIEHSEILLAAIRKCGIGAVLLRGGAAYKRDREMAIEKLSHGEVRAGVGTSTAYTGMDIDRIDRGIVAIPSANNLPQLKQMRGRFCRLFDGKDAQLDYVWDRYLFPQAGKNLRREFGDDVTFEEDNDYDDEQ